MSLFREVLETSTDAYTGNDAVLFVYYLDTDASEDTPPVFWWVATVGIENEEISFGHFGSEVEAREAFAELTTAEGV